jgi:hypothetical protein
MHYNRFHLLWILGTCVILNGCSRSTAHATAMFRQRIWTEKTASQDVQV